MGFKYVFIPAADCEPMQEMTYSEDVVTLETDSFRPFCENFFASAGKTADRAVLLEQLKQRTGVDVTEKAGESKLGPEAMDRLLSSTSVEIFPVQLPTKESGFHGISAYCDDKGVAKELEENTRASGLVQACGYPGQTFRGDIFLGRVFDDNEDEWKRIDFTLADCSTDASWVEQVKKQRSNRSVGDMASLGAKMGVNNAAQINPSMLPDSTPSGDAEHYTWRQTEDEVEVTFKKEGLQKSDKKVVKVVFSRQKLKVEVKGEVLLDTELNMPTQSDESTWTLMDGVLQVNLSKASSESWPDLAK